MKTFEQPLVRSNKDRCRVCYTCVRECPAKAIRISQGQAEVIAQRCIGCGNCVRVCTQNAKEILSATESVLAILATGGRSAALVAPSFPVEFDEISHEVFVGALHRLGFTYVNEVAYGADLVAAGYRELLEKNPSGRYIASTCPALVAYVERYHPSLVRHLAPLVSPMVATARAVRAMYGSDVKTVFISPCIAKKAEAMSDLLNTEIDAVLTFTELRNMFTSKNVEVKKSPSCTFDPPHAVRGRLVPIARGLLQAAQIGEDFVTGDIVCADGRDDFIEAIREFETGTMHTRLLEILCCKGCIMGAGISRRYSLFQRRSKVSNYVRVRAALCENSLATYPVIELSRWFQGDDQRLQAPRESDVRAIMVRMGKRSVGDELNCGACGYSTCRAHAEAVNNGLAENEMCLPFTIEELRKTVRELACSNQELAQTQEALMQSEKMASLGQLAAGIAHEVNNPLGVVLMYANLLMEQLDDDAIRQDAAMIIEQADRCKKIVSGMLNFARQNRIVRQQVDIHLLVRKSIRAVAIPSTIKVEQKLGCVDAIAELDSDQFTQVLINLLSNAVAAMPDGGLLKVEADGTDDTVEFRIIDTGIGIPKENLGKIFEPFFTTKQIGKGTGLGLAVAYGIVKMHDGEIRVISNSDAAVGPTGTTFRVVLPRTGDA